MARLRQDKMTEKQRWQALISREPVDRVPLFLYALGFSAQNVGYPKARIYDDPEKSFWAQVWTNDMYGALDFVVYTGGAFGVREFGGDVKMPNGEYDMAVTIRRPPVESEKDVYKIELPDVKNAGAMPSYMEFAKLEEQHDFPITVRVGGILTRVGYMCEIERMCRWIMKKPELVHRLCRLWTDFFVESVKYWVETFKPEYIVGYCGSPTESNQMISPKHFKEFALPYQREVYEKAQAMGVTHFFTHMCGEQNLNLPYWAEFLHGDPGIISIGHEIEIEIAMKYFPNDIILGNVNPAIIQIGSPNEVYEQARICIEKGKKCPGGFILGPGCELPIMAPSYNVWMLRKAIDDFGWYE